MLAGILFIKFYTTYTSSHNQPREKPNDSPLQPFFLCRRGTLLSTLTMLPREALLENSDNDPEGDYEAWFSLRHEHSTL